MWDHEGPRANHSEEALPLLRQNYKRTVVIRKESELFAESNQQELLASDQEDSHSTVAQ